MRYFCDRKTPTSNEDRAKGNLPLLALHVTTFLEERHCVGITFPHGVFDASGMGMILRYLNAELNGIEWDPPILMNVDKNDLTAAIDVLKATKLSDTIDSLPVWRDFVKYNWWTGLKLDFAYWVQKSWFCTQQKSVYLDDEVVKRLVDKVKEDVNGESGGREFVSTGDVLFSWFLKVRWSSFSFFCLQIVLTSPSFLQTSFSDEPSNKSILSVCSVLTTRSLLSLYTPLPSLLSYPHNAVILFYYPQLSISSLPSTSLPTLSSLHRQSLLSSRTPSYLLSTVLVDSSQLVPKVSTKEARTVYTNQVVAGLTEIKFGKEIEIEQFWVYSTPWETASRINRMKEGGYVISARMRPSRWKAIEKGVEKLLAEADM